MADAPAPASAAPAAVDAEIDVAGIEATVQETYANTPGDDGERMQAAVSEGYEYGRYAVGYHRSEWPVAVTAEVLHSWTMTADNGSEYTLYVFGNGGGSMLSDQGGTAVAWGVGGYANRYDTHLDLIPIIPYDNPWGY